jgi:hypothetical protein
MLTHGSDRARRTGAKVILQSAIVKGWTPRTAKTLTSAEFPGTAVLWDEEYFEVLEATPLQTGGVRYLLGPWSDHHTIRTFEQYDAASEELRVADRELARRQRRASIVGRLSGIVLGFLPASVQNHLENELGVRASTMTMLSCVLGPLLLGRCILVTVDAKMHGTLPPVPLPVWLLVLYLMLESLVRFFVAMSQARPMGSLFAYPAYLLYRAVSRKGAQLPPARGARGDSVAFTPPTEDVVLRGSFEIKEPLLTLLTPAEQQQLAERFGYDYRRTAPTVAWIILTSAALGTFSAYTELATNASLGSFLSMLIAAAVVLEQALRLHTLRRQPASSVFGYLVRPVVRNLLKG